ncbi:MAG TPA: DNA-processing protein DprA [Gemmatimonadaceae bacterium]
MSSRTDLIALSLLPIWRWRAVAEQLRSGQPALDILHAHCADGRRRSTPPTWADAWRLLQRARDAARRGDAAGLHTVAFDDEAYPPRLLHIADPPPMLWVRGQVSALADPAVAIVGSRAGSEYALSVATRLAADLSARGLTVVSGLARGVDSAAHQGALSADGATVGVLGCGADLVYPPEHAALASDMTRRGAVVSELAPGTVPKPGFFPRRNRIISGLVRAVVVVEAGERSGSLITARCALEQGRDVLAVPGNVLSERNRGGHALLRDGARLVESADDVLDELGLTAGIPAGGNRTHAAGDPVLAAILAGEAADLEQISARSGLSAVQLLPRLLDLELHGMVRREAGGRFVRVDRTC